MEYKSCGIDEVVSCLIGRFQNRPIKNISSFCRGLKNSCRLNCIASAEKDFSKILRVCNGGVQILGFQTGRLLKLASPATGLFAKHRSSFSMRFCFCSHGLHMLGVIIIFSLPPLHARVDGTLKRI